MRITLDAIFEDGAFHPARPVELPEGAAVRLTIEPVVFSAVSEPASSVATEPESEANSHDPLAVVIGIGTTEPAISMADRHDEVIYDGLKLRNEDQQ